MKEKKCFKCNKNKPITHFYKHVKMGDGYLGKCKECTKEDVSKNRSERSEYYKEFDRKRASLPKRIKLRKQIAERWKSDPKLRKRKCKLKKAWAEKNIVKRAAHMVTGNAIRAGVLILEPCEVCGKKKVDAHHDDYSSPLDVRWLCRKHHAEHHAKAREQERNK